MDHSDDVDIVQRAIAILDEEVRSWVRLRGLPGSAEPVSPPDEQSQGGDGQ